MTTNTITNNNNEISFWKIIKNKLLFKNILKFLSYDEYKERWYHEGSDNNFASSPTHSIQYLVDNQLKKQLKHKILNGHYLTIGKCTTQQILQMYKDDNFGGNEEITNQFYEKLFSIIHEPSSHGDLIYRIIICGNFNALKYYWENNKFNSIGQIISSSMLNERFEFAIWFLNNFKEKNNGRNYFETIKQLKEVINIDRITISSNNGLVGYQCLNSIFENIVIPNYRLKKSTDQLFTTLKSNLFKKCPLSLNFTIECVLESCKTLAYINRIITRSKYTNGQLESQEIDTSSDTGIIEYIICLHSELTDQFKQQQILAIQITSLILPVLKYYSKSIPLDKTLFQYISSNSNDGVDEIKTVLSNDLNCSFQYGSFEIFKNWYDTTEMKYLKGQDDKLKSPNTLLTELYKMESVPKLFSFCFNGNGGGIENKIKFINNVCDLILQEQVYSKYQINPLYFFSMVVELNDMEIIEFTFNRLLSKLGVNKSSIQADDGRDDEDDRPNKRLKSDKVLDKQLIVPICNSVCLCSNVKSVNVLKFIYKHFSESTQHWKTDKWRINGRMDLIKHFESMVPINHKFSYSYGYYGFKHHQLEYLRNAVSTSQKYQVVNDKITIFFAIDPTITNREMDNIKYVIKNTNTVYRFISGLNESPSHRFIEFSNWWNVNGNELKPRILQFPNENDSSTFKYISGKSNLVSGLITEFINYHFIQANNNNDQYPKSWFNLAEKNADLYILDAIIKDGENQLSGNTITFRFLKFLLSSIAWDSSKLVQYLYVHHLVFFEELVEAIIFLSVDRHLHQVFKYLIDIKIIDISAFNFDQLIADTEKTKQKFLQSVSKNNGFYNLDETPQNVSHIEESEDEDEPPVVQNNHQEAAAFINDNEIQFEEEEEEVEEVEEEVEEEVNGHQEDDGEMVQEQAENNNNEEEGLGQGGNDANDNGFIFQYNIANDEYDTNFQYFDLNRNPLKEKENIHKIINSKKGWFNNELLNAKVMSFIFRYYPHLIKSNQTNK